MYFTKTSLIQTCISTVICELQSYTNATLVNTCISHQIVY